ncbi:hypothetical protein Syun_019731 [Stephania yunnanensis]|uniref:Uncharacterized protein n=1 Tax=Stephania yunnanensis TaxID=152371 RepID=A0AAP0IUQ9_9MAGN
MNEYRLLNPQPAIMSDSSSKGRTSGDDDQVLPHFMASPRTATTSNVTTKLIMWNWCLKKSLEEALEAKIIKVVIMFSSPRTTTTASEHHEQQLHHMELVPHHHDLPHEFWVNHHDNSSLEVLQEAAPTGRIGSLLLPDQLDDNGTDDEEVGDDQDWIENLESTLEVDDEEQQPLQQLPLIHQQFDQQHQPWPQVLQQNADDSIITIEDYDDIPPCIFLDEYQSNFDSWMETIKKRGHDEQQQQVDEEEDEPSLKRAKARVAN